MSAVSRGLGSHARSSATAQPLLCLAESVLLLTTAAPCCHQILTHRRDTRSTYHIRGVRCAMLRVPVRVFLAFQAVSSRLAPQALQTKRHAANLSTYTYHQSPSIRQSGGALLTQPSLHRMRKTLQTSANVAWFHSTQRRQGLLPVLLGAFKVTTTII